MNKTSKFVAKGGNGQGQVISSVLIVGIAIFGLSGWVWWHTVRSDPQRTLYGAIENNLRVRSMTRQVTQESGQQALDQGVELSLGAEPVAHGFATNSRTGGVSAIIKTETISTPTEEYTRYTAIETNQQNSKGKKLNFEDILNIWSKTSSDQTGEPGALFSEPVLGVVPAANLDTRDRQVLMKIIRDDKIYTFDEKTLERKIRNGRPTYSYDVTVKLSEYLQLLKQVAKVSHIQSAQLESLDPSQYENEQPLIFKLTVDVWSQRITEVVYDGGARTESFGSYGIHHEVDKPKESIPVEELQAKLQAVQE